MSLRWRLILISATVFLFGYYALANVASEEARLESPLIPAESLRLGLDLRGGIHWVIGVKLATAEEHELGFLKGVLENDLLSDEITVGEISIEGDRLRVETFTDTARTGVREWREGRSTAWGHDRADHGERCPRVRGSDAGRRQRCGRRESRLS